MALLGGRRVRYGNRGALLDGSAAQVDIFPEVDLHRALRMRAHVDMEKGIPRRINGDAAVPDCSRIDVAPPADHHLASVKDRTVEHSPSPADAALVDMPDQSEKAWMAHVFPSCSPKLTVNAWKKLRSVLRYSYARKAASCPFRLRPISTAAGAGAATNR